MRSTFAAAILAIGLAACSRFGDPTALPQGESLAGSRHDSSSFKALVEFDGINGCTPLAGVVAYNKTLYGTTTCGGQFGEGEVYHLNTAGKFNILHSFTRDAKYAYAPVIVGASGIYGTAAGGGTHHGGTVYSLDLRGKEQWVYSFRHNPFPYAGLVDVNGTLYGTTVGGGTGTCYSEPGCGTVFAVSSSGKGKVIYSFKGGSDGAAPWSGLVDVNGTLYGATSGGGYLNDGTVFSITTSGVEHVLHAFGSSSGRYDGSDPFGTLVFANGVLYGTTESGGNGNWGTVFSITTSGKENVLYSFGKNGSHDALNPEAGLLYYKGMLYGTSAEGGGSGCGGAGCGTIYEISPSGQEQVLYLFQGGSDGWDPQSQLAQIDGVLYGTAPKGGNSYNQGTVFALTP